MDNRKSGFDVGRGSGIDMGNMMGGSGGMDLSSIVQMLAASDTNPLDLLPDDFKTELAQYLTEREREIANSLERLESEAGLPERERVDIPDSEERAEEIIETVDSMLNEDFRRYYVEELIIHPIEEAPDISGVYGDPAAWLELREQWAENLPDNSDETVDAFLREVFAVGLDEFRVEVVEPWSSWDRGKAVSEIILGIRSEVPDRLDRVRKEMIIDPDE